MQANPARRKETPPFFDAIFCILSACQRKIRNTMALNLRHVVGGAWPVR
jgi:hypothetical protein